MRKFVFFLVSLVMILFTTSCEKEEGEGGNSTIMGRVLVKNYNSDFTIKLGEYYAPNVDVYIIYGNDSIYSDKFDTSLDGWFRFEYLNKGTYTVYALSADSTRQSPSGEIAVKKTIEITDNNSTVIVDDLVIFD
ncbi:hypothetical protein ACUNWD_09370 [Sunxiuqinia sp. A32]|uniref:hypothetical protein n=1 Tax=Sunxiuqinia sp. A32 TaxID=3461496 RepID=UPI004045952F